MKTPRDYIVFPLDVPSLEEAKPLISLLADSVGMFKVGLELFIRSGPETVRYIKESTGAKVFLDLKLHDIPETVRRAMGSVAELSVDLATIHCGESRAMLEAAVAGGGGKVNILGVTVLTSVSGEDLAAAGFTPPLTEPSNLVIKRAKAAKEAGLSGIVCSGLEAALIKETCGKDFLCVTPGIRPAWELTKDDQQRVATPAKAIRDGADYLVIGRPIRNAADPRDAARRIAEEIEIGLA